MVRDFVRSFGTGNIKYKLRWQQYQDNRTTPRHVGRQSRPHRRGRDMQPELPNQAVEREDT